MTLMRLPTRLTPARPNWEGRDLATARASLENLEYPHRRWLAQALWEALPHRSPANVLEVGSAYGPNLIHLNRLAPDWHFTGLDISPVYVALGRTEVEKLGVPNISLEQHDLAHQLPYANCTFDAVFSDAVIMYARPRHARRILKDMIRVSRETVAVLELTGGNRIFPHRPNRDGWLHDYPSLLARHRDVRSVTSIAMPTGSRVAGRWPVYGRLTIARVDGSA